MSNYTLTNESHNTTSPLNDLNTLSGIRSAMEEYEKVHGTVALVVCIVGVTLNIINVVVLSHKEMVSPVNRLLQAIGESNCQSCISINISVQKCP